MLTARAATRIRLSVALLLAAVTCLAVPATRAPAQADGWVPHYDGPWTVTMISDHEELLRNRIVTLDENNADLTFNDEGGHFYFEAQSRLDVTDHFEIGVVSNPYQTLREGFWRHSTSYAGVWWDDVAGNFTLSRNGTACPSDRTHVDIRRLHRTAGVLDQLWMFFERRCRGYGTALFGEIRIGLPPQELDATPRAVRWPSTSEPHGVSRTVPVHFQSEGTMTPATVAIHGRDAASFRVMSHTCAPPAPASTCVVRINFRATSPGPKRASLVLSSSSRSRRVPLDGFGRAGRTSWVTDSDPGDWVGDGREFRRSTRVHGDIGFNGGRQRVDSWILWGGWHAVFVPPPGERLRVRTYSNVRRWPFNDGRPGMTVTGEGRGCNKINGSFTVHQVTFTSAGRLVRLDLSFHQYCDTYGPALHGRLRYNAAQDTRGPGAVSGARARRVGDKIYVAWANPSATDFARATVRWYHGTGPAARLTDVGWPAAPTSSRTAVFAAAPDKRVTISIIATDINGNPGATTVLSVPPAG